MYCIVRGEVEVRHKHMHHHRHHGRKKTGEAKQESTHEHAALIHADQKNSNILSNDRHGSKNRKEKTTAAAQASHGMFHVDAHHKHNDHESHDEFSTDSEVESDFSESSVSSVELVDGLKKEHHEAHYSSTSSESRTGPEFVADCSCRR